MEKCLTLMQRVAICFAAGVIGALAVLLFGRVLFGLGLSAAFGIKAPIPLSPPDVYRPLFWGGLWGILFGLFMKTSWKHLYLFGLLFFLAPVLGLQQGPLFAVYLLLVNLPFGIVTALAAMAIIGKNPTFCGVLK
ncbi:MAG: hypothetical protein ABSF90_25645 [Syntrophobacteraceae bacterium]